MDIGLSGVGGRGDELVLERYRADLAERGVALGFDEAVEVFIGASLAVGMGPVRGLPGGRGPGGFPAREGPARAWLNPELRYLRSARARNIVRCHSRRGSQGPSS